ncbi:MAG: aminopeptidase P family protein [Bacteroidaceae bacterium]|nr:aminopeptidase P family protein [Bacteroidaceae bacterium]
MLFSKNTYTERRARLRELVGNGLIVLIGNNESPYNYPANVYKFRQDSSFLYFTGQHREGLALAIDCESGVETLIGNDIDINDIIWTGPVPSVRDMANESGIAETAPMNELARLVELAKHTGRRVHFLPPYRHDTMIQLMDLTGIHPRDQREAASLELIHAVVALRNIKSDEEIAELERAQLIGYEMHTTAMRLATQPGMTEAYIGGVLDGIAASHGSHVSFPSIVSMHGEVLHGHPSARPLDPSRLLLVDCGAETREHYCSDHTRTTPISGRFSQRQREIYDIVVDCHDLALDLARPGVRYVDVHLACARLMTERLRDLGLMKGDVDEAVAAGAHALFMPHGLGHAMGMDVHDMEGLGQRYVGYDEETQPATQFGLASLRFGRRLEVGHVITDEPGIYFIPDLIDLWRREGTNSQFLNFDRIETYKDFGGIRIEDDLLITPDGCRFLGEKRIPYHAADVEAFLAQ